MSQPPAQPPPPKSLVMWIVWLSLVMGIFIIQFLAAGGLSFAPDKGTAPLPMIGIGAGLAFASLVVRFVLLPTRKTIEQQFPLMIVGLAMAEGCGFLGAFVLSPDFPHTKLWLFVAAVTCMLLHAPFYAKEKGAGDRYQR